MHVRTRSVFPTIRSEGALLPPDLLRRVHSADKNLRGLTPEAYHLPGGMRLNEAASRAWNALLGAWATFREARDRLPEGDPGTSITRERWLLPLFQELNYGRLQTRVAEEIEGKSYPISHGWGHLPLHLVGYNVDLDRRTSGVAGASRSSPYFALTPGMTFVSRTLLTQSIIVWLQGGIIGKTYSMTMGFNTTLGKTIYAQFFVTIKDK